MSQILYKATFKAANQDDADRGVWVEDTSIPRIPCAPEGTNLTADEITKMMKSIGEQNRVWHKLKIFKQVRLVE